MGLYKYGLAGIQSLTQQVVKYGSVILQWVLGDVFVCLKAGVDPSRLCNTSPLLFSAAVDH